MFFLSLLIAGLLYVISFLVVHKKQKLYYVFLPYFGILALLIINILISDYMDNLVNSKNFFSWWFSNNALLLIVNTILCAPFTFFTTKIFFKKSK